MNNTSEYKSGFVAGIARAIISQPFDTVKTIMQTGKYPNSINCLKEIVKNNGVNYLYKGLTFPLIGNSFIVGTHFHIYNTYKDKMPALCVGSLAGLCGSLIANPVELVRIKMQMSIKNKKNYKNSFICMKNIIEYSGHKGLL